MGNYRYLSLVCIFVLVLFVAQATAAPGNQDGQESDPHKVKELSGISIVGNDEAPKSLYIVPWKGSEIGSEISLGLAFDHSLTPVDRVVFARQLTFYNLCKSINNRR